MEYIVHMAVFASQSTLQSEVYFVPIMYVSLQIGRFIFVFIWMCSAMSPLCSGSTPTF